MQTIAVAPVLIFITVPPISQTINEGGTVNFSVAISNGGGTTTYLWQESSDGGATYSNIPGADAATYAILSVTLAHDERSFRCIVSNACLSDTSAAATLEVNCTSAAPAQPGAISGGSLICPNVSLTYSIVPVAGATNYIWTLPSGWTGNSTTTSIDVTTNGTGGLLKVRALNDCGASGEQTLPIALNPDPCRRGVHFDGMNDHITVGQNDQALSGDLTLSFWVKPERLTGEQTLIFNGRECIVGLSNQQIRYKHSDDCCGYDNTVDLIFPSNLDLGKWTHIAITRAVENRSISVYLNGNFVQTQTYGGSSAQPGDHTTDMIFGGGKNGSWAHFSGALDEIKIWSVLRSVDELKQDMVCVPLGNEPDLKAYYDFETGQPYGDNLAVTNFVNLVNAYGEASVRNMAMNGTASNVVSGDQPSFLFQDLDGDGFGGANAGCNYTGPTVVNSNDCDDQNSAINPDAIEICNGIDDDCSGIIDDIPNPFASTNVPVPIPDGQTITSSLTVNSPVTTLLDLNVLNLNISHIWIADLTVVLKSPQGTEVTLLQSICGDQDDILINFDDESMADYGTFPCPPVNNGTYKPLSPLSAFDGENPNGTWTLTVIDVYEDGGSLDAWSIGFPSTPVTLYADSDGDGYGNAAVSILACSTLAGYVSDATDCDDTNGQIYPGATEVCNDYDDDCDGMIDEGVSSDWYADADGDGHGNVANVQTACSQPVGYVASNDDCDDADSAVYPGAAEICNSLDDDCNGQIDENAGPIWYVDIDGDSFGSSVASVQACVQPVGYVANVDDCDDNNSAIYPNATEIPNGLDDDCNSIVDDTLVVSSVKQLSGNHGGGIQFMLLPNPADDVLQIVFAGNEVALGRVEIFNPIGQRILTQDIQLEPGEKGAFQIGHLPQGHYFLIFRRADGARSGERFIIVRDYKR